MRTRRKRWPVILAILLIAAVVLGAAFTWHFLRQSSAASDRLVDHILAHPESASVAVYTFGENENITEDGHSLFLNPDQPLTLASTTKIMVLAAYADGVANGELDPQESISITEWERYYLPFTDGGAHASGLNRLGLAADDLGFALEPQSTVTLEDLASVMMYESGNAATDVLIERIGTERINSVMAEAGMELHSQILPTLGPALAMVRHDQAPLSSSELSNLIADVSSGETAYLDELGEAYLNDSAWRSAQIQYLASDQEASNESMIEAWTYQREASQLFPAGTAREYAHIMARVASGTFLSQEASSIMSQILETAPSDWPLRRFFFHTYGAKDGVAPGVLTLATYAVPRRGELAGQSRVVVLFINGLPLEPWIASVQYLGIYRLQTDLAQAGDAFLTLSQE